MKKSVAVYLRGGKLYLVPTGKTSKGLTVEVEPVSTLDFNASAEEVGNAFLSTLEKCGKVVPHPDNWNEFKSPVENVTKVKSWNEFVKSTRASDVRLDDTGYIITPLRPAKRGNFEFDSDRAIKLPFDVSPDEVGKKIIEVLTTAEQYRLR